MKRKRWLGIPIPVIAVGLSILLVTTGALAAFLWSMTVPSTVKIIGGEVLAFEDEACTIPLVDLDFGTIRADETTASIAFWIANIGDDPVYVAIAQADLDALLVLYEGVDTVVPADPSRLPLTTGLIQVYQDTATTTSLFGPIDEAGTSLCVATGDWGTPGPGVIRIDDELIYYGSAVDQGDRTDLNNCQRGYDGTTAASHAEGASVILQELGDIPGYVLAPTESIAVSTYLVADAAITRSDKPFTLILEAKDSAY